MSMPLDTHIHFLIPVPDWQPEAATPLQGFSLSLCGNSWLIDAACFFPSNIYDFTEEGHETFLARRIGGINPVRWYPQSPHTLTSIPVPAYMPFTVVLFGEGQSLDPYAAWAKSSGVPPTMVAEKGGDLTYEQFDLEGLQRRFLSVCDLIPESVSPDAVRNAKSAIESWVPPPKRRLSYQVGGHRSVSPNLMALSAAGFTDMIYGPFEKINRGNEPYVEQIVKTTRSIFEERDKIGEKEADRTFHRPPDLNLFAPAIYPGFFQARSHNR